MARVIVEEYDIQEDWRCGSCKRRCPGMDGTERRSLKCTNCGHEKTDADPWLTDGDEGPALTGEKAAWAALGENLNCPFCHAQSRADATECEECGASLKEPSPAPTPTPPPVVRQAPREEFTYRQSTYQAPSVPAPSTFDSLATGRIRTYIGVAAGFAGLIALLVWGLTPNRTVARVEVITWTRTVTLEEQHEYTHAGWQDQIPVGAFNVTACVSTQRGTHDCNPYLANCRYLNNCNCTGGGTERCNPYTEQENYNCRDVPDRSRCTRTRTTNRNGSAKIRVECETREVCDQRPVRRWRQCVVPRVCQRCPTQTCDTFYRQCPTYVNWCQYRTRQWDQVDYQVASQHDHNPRWPEVHAPNPFLPHRQHTTEDYVIRLRDMRDSSRSWNNSVSAGEFSRYAVGQRWDAEWSTLGGITLQRMLEN